MATGSLSPHKGANSDLFPHTWRPRLQIIYAEGGGVQDAGMGQALVTHSNRWCLHNVFLFPTKLAGNGCVNAMSASSTAT